MADGGLKFVGMTREAHDQPAQIEREKKTTPGYKCLQLAEMAHRNHRDKLCIAPRSIACHCDLSLTYLVNKLNCSIKLENDALFLQEKNDALNRASFISWKMMQ